MRNVFLRFRCDQYSNCLEGKAKKIKNCTIFSPHICEGCADGYFFDPGKGMKGGCCKCSSPCAIFEDETMPCSTEHDRKCTAKWKKPIILVLSKFISYNTKGHISIGAQIIGLATVKREHGIYRHKIFHLLNVSVLKIARAPLKRITLFSINDVLLTRFIFGRGCPERGPNRSRAPRNLRRSISLQQKCLNKNKTILTT